MKKVAIIMAGGAGERFWPLSRKKNPKQLLKLFSDKTMLEEAIDRIASVVDRKDIYIITNTLLKTSISKELSDFPEENIIAEPTKMNTAPCLALGLSLLLSRYTLPAHEIIAGVFTADHFIRPLNKFADDIQTAYECAGNHPYLVTLGIPPSRPEIGYGYIESGSPIEAQNPVLSVVSFREKPDINTALSFIAAGTFFWNSGMFFYRLDTFSHAIGSTMPITYEFMNKITEHLCNENGDIHDEKTASFFNKMEATSIDYGVLEKISNVAVLPASFLWDDVGSWDALARLGDSNHHNSIEHGNIISIDTKESILWNEHPEILLTSVGTENMTIILTKDALLVCPIQQAQQVKLIVQQLKNNDLEHLL